MPELASPNGAPSEECTARQCGPEGPLSRTCSPQRASPTDRHRGSRPLRDLLVDPALLRNGLQVVSPPPGLRDLPLLKPVPAFTTDCRIIHGRNLAPLLTVDEADECHEQKLPAPCDESARRT